MTNVINDDCYSQKLITRNIDYELYNNKISTFVDKSNNRLYITDPTTFDKSFIDTNKFTLIFDIDETLIFIKQGDIVSRPFLDKLLNFIRNKFNVIIWTAGCKKHATFVLHFVDPECNIRYCICESDWGTLYSKNINILNIDTSKTLLIDNTFFCIQSNTSNSILINSFDENSHDDTLLLILIKILKRLLKHNKQICDFLRFEKALRLCNDPIIHYHLD